MKLNCKMTYNLSGNSHTLYFTNSSEMRMEDPAQMAGEFLQPYRFTGKELDRVNGLNMYDFGARWYDVAGVPMWTSVDPLAEKYYHISPYAYCGGDSVNFVDPDGMKVTLVYKNGRGEMDTYTFSGFHGEKSITVPNQPFILDFIKAYAYNTYNGGGDNMCLAVNSNDYNIFVYDATAFWGDNAKTYYESERNEQHIYWESHKGLKTTEGGCQSAATRLEHEFDHAVFDKMNHQQHRLRREVEDSQYENKEERRVITGSETKTAKANNESVRKDHKGTTYDTVSPISIKPRFKEQKR